MLHAVIITTAAVNLEGSRGVLGMTEFDGKDETACRWR